MIVFPDRSGDIYRRITQLPVSTTASLMRINPRTHFIVKGLCGGDIGQCSIARLGGMKSI